MSKKNDGGAAFPQETPGPYRAGRKERGPSTMRGGMTLRDWFAGQCLIGCVQHAYTSCIGDAELADDCYRMADAMIAERERAQ